MDFVAPTTSADLVQCCNCGCSCSLMNNGLSASWIRSVKRKFDEFEEGHRILLPGIDYSSFARVEVENECVALREMVSNQQQTIQDLCEELDEERNASSSAANEAMSMILRLQREKAEIQMEARQFKRFAEEKMAHDQQELLALEDLLYKREQAIQSLTCEVQAYKHRMLSYGFTEEEVEGEKMRAHSRNNSAIDNESPFEFTYDYPPLKCNLNENQFSTELDVVDVEKHAFGETPRGRDHLKNLENRIYQLENSPRCNQIDMDCSSSKNIMEKVIVGQSPIRPRHLRRFSTDSSNSFMGTTKESGFDFTGESPRAFGSFKKMDYTTYTEDYSNLRKFDNASEAGDDMSDRVYTIDSIHNGVPDPKVHVSSYDDYVTTPQSLNRVDLNDPDIKKLYMRLQALEADRESMRQAIISMRTDKAQLILLKEIAQQLCKDMSPEKRMPVKKTSLVGIFSFVSIFKWVVSFMFWKKKARRSKYMFGIASNSVGLRTVLEKGPRMRQWRCLTSTQG
ncbi:GTD-binding domain [Dillenia turbinata]|uniref:GTD-binding domain n=1 Tax=Dillenia turbinata TaxID=194707 RepID=A0AAN8WA32_9MAGN